jgi:hypothetical protein
MLEAQQLRIEETSARIGAALMLLLRRTLRRIMPLAFWRVPSLEMLLPSGIFQRNDIFANSNASGSYHDLTAQFFRENPGSNKEGMGISGDDDRAVELAEQNFIMYRPRPAQLDVDRVYGHSYRPE